MAATGAPIRVDVWSDVVCPWCSIGKVRFDGAVSDVADEIAVEVRYHAFQLDPTAPPGTAEPVVDAYARKFGGLQRANELIDRVTAIAASEGIQFRLDRAKRANTRLAHRLIVLAGGPRLEVGQAALKQRLMAAYFTDGLDVGDPDTLAACVAELGGDASEVLTLLDSDAGIAEVDADLRQARDLGISGVPNYVIDGQWSVPGAQDRTTFANVLRRLHARRLEAGRTDAT